MKKCFAKVTSVTSSEGFLVFQPSSLAVPDAGYCYMHDVAWSVCLFKAVTGIYFRGGVFGGRDSKARSHYIKLKTTVLCIKFLSEIWGFQTRNTPPSYGLVSVDHNCMNQLRCRLGCGVSASEEQCIRRGGVHIGAT